jgi:hypothetical protein
MQGSEKGREATDPNIFFHPDYTVGPGVPPGHALRLAGCTADRDFHPALKIVFIFEKG